MANYNSNIDIGREFINCRNPKSSLLIEPLDKHIVESAIKKYFNSQYTDKGKAKARILNAYLGLKKDFKKDVALKDVADESGYAYETVKKYFRCAMDDIVAYIPPEYRP